MADTEEMVVGGRESWWRRHSITVAILILAASISFVIRTLYAYPLIATCDVYNCFAGGSDSFYHFRVMSWIISNHTNLVHDPALNYPLGSTNPREPLFDWMNAILGIIFAPLFGGNAIQAGSWVLEMQPPFWAAVGVVPVYLIGKEVSSRRMGLLAALLYPLVVGNIESTVATYANYLPFYTFFVLLSAYTYVHTIKLAGGRRWVETYRSPRAIWEGIKQFVREEENAVRWSVFTGVTLGATMFAWQGYTYVVALVMVFMFIVVLTERLRRHDSFGAYLVTILTGTIGFLMAMPYYFFQGEFGYWFTVPLLLFFGGLLVLLPFILLRDSPWVISVPVLLGSVALAGAGLYVYSPYDFQSILTGQGYFVKNLIFSTVAEAQAPSFDALIVSYGIATFLLTFVGLALFVAYLFIYRFRREHVFMVVLGLMGIYLPISAAKFFLLGSPIYVLLPAEALVLGIDRIGGYPQLRRNLSSLSDRGGRLMALRRSFKARNLILGVVVLLVVIPNVSWAVDAGIPYNVQSQYSQQIYASLPSALQTNPSNASSFYLGIAGIQTDTPQQYDESGYNWLSTQDTQLPMQDRPAFVSWWDYGFQAIAEGDHPSVADNFQEGIDPSGNFLLAQNESLAISTLAADLLYAKYSTPSAAPQCDWNDLMATLHGEYLNTTQLQYLLGHGAQDIGIVAGNPGLYGPKNDGNLDTVNAMYDAVSYQIADTLSENQVVAVYQSVQACTGWSIRYAMADTRLFPTSYSNTGIYYAPVDLTDGVIGSGGIPTYYFTVDVTASDGNTYPLGQVPAGLQTVSGNINYNTPFYNSMIYKIEEGFNGSQVGQGSGIPGLTDTSVNPEPGWMMQHFVLGYRTAYYCPYTDYQAHPNCFSAVNLATAAAHQKLSQGTSDASTTTYYDSGGETILEYYAGAKVEGQVTTYAGTPVPGIRVTVDDSWGTPHMTTVTDSNGDFSLIAPPGNVSLIASYGALNPLTQVGTTQLSIWNTTVSSAQGFGSDPTPVLPHIYLPAGSIEGQVYWNKANQTGFQAGDVSLPGATVTVSNGLGLTQSAVSDASGTFAVHDLTAGAYNVSVTVGAFTETESPVDLLPGQTYSDSLGLGVPAVHGRVVNQTGGAVAGAQISISGPNGFFERNVTNALGNYSFSPLEPGNYTLLASDLTGQTSLPTHVGIASFSSNVTLNITLETPVAVSLLPLLNGNILPNLPVRFTGVGSGASGSLILMTGANGWVHATLPSGNWSVYALGVDNGTYVAGVDSLHLSPSSSLLSSTGAVLPLSVAEPITGYAYISSESGPQSGVTVTFQNAQGIEVQTTTDAAGSYHVWLPTGTYTVVANSSRSGATAALAATDLTSPTTLDLSLTTSVSFSALVGYLTPTGSFETLPGTPVNVTLDTAPAATLQLTASSAGNVSAQLPETSSLFTVTASRFGFAPYSRGPIPESSLATTVSRIDLNISKVPVNVVIWSNTSFARSSLQVNFTGITPSTESENVTGAVPPTHTNITVDLYPGVYEVSAWAPSATSGVIRPFTNLTLDVPVGSRGVYLNFTTTSSLRYILNTTTPLLELNATSLELTSSLGTIEMNGTQALRGFEAPPGTYNLWATSRAYGGVYSYFDPITLYPNGTALPHNITLLPASTVDLSLQAPWGQTIQSAVSIAVANGNGTSGSFVTYPTGNATLLLPRGVYNYTLNTTIRLTVDGVSQYWTIATDPARDTCAVGLSGTSICTLELNVTRSTVTLSPLLSVNGAHVSGGDGTVIVMSSLGYPRTFPITDGRVSFSLLPGNYTLYTVLSGNGVPEVNITTVSFGYVSAPLALVLDLKPGWVQTLALTAAPGLPSPAVVTLVFRHAGGPNITLENVSVGDFPLSLASGSYSIQATASVAPYGPTVPLLAQANITVSSSNAFVPMPLRPQWQRSATLTIVGGGLTTVGDGSTVSYEAVVNNTGNAPLSLHAVGTPSTWTIIASPANFTLGTAYNNRSQVVEFLVTVPAGQSVPAPSVVLEVDLVGSTTPLTQTTAALSVVPRYGITLATLASFNEEKTGVVVLGFALGAGGNTAESVTLSVQNGAELKEDGWTYSVVASSTGVPVTGAESVSPSAAQFQGEVDLFARSPAPIFPPGVVVEGVDLSHPQVTASVELPMIGHALLGVNSSVVVTGPSVGGTPPPTYDSWLVPLLTVLPAIVIIAVAITWRWWRTRKWVRK